MREILFRGKRRDNGEWVYGSLLKPGNGPHECTVIRVPDPERRYSVFEKTVGEYTGLDDKNGKKIFEGDIVAREDYGYGCGRYYATVHYGAFNCSCCHGVYGWTFDKGDIRNPTWYEVIGNIHDNPELLKEDT